jgi:hypothetical protein
MSGHYLSTFVSKVFKTTPRRNAGEEWLMLFLRVSAFIPRRWFSTMQQSLLNKSIVLHWSIYSEFWLVLKYSNPLHSQFFICVLFLLPWYPVLYIWILNCFHKCKKFVPSTIMFTLPDVGSNDNLNQFSEFLTVSATFPFFFFFFFFFLPCLKFHV